MANLKIKEYISISEKIDMINLIIQSCINDDKLDVFKKELSTVYYISQFYSVFRAVKIEEISDDGESFEVVDILSTYDKLMSGGFYKQIVDGISEFEYKTIMRLIDESINENLRQKNYFNLMYDQLKDLDSLESLKMLSNIDKEKVDEIRIIAEKIK
jgi:hypothetical protein